MSTATLRRATSHGWAVGAATLLLASALVAIGWFDYASARREFSALVRAQAASARDTVAAAARANRAAAEEARLQLAERLLDNARLLAEIDRRGGLSPTALQDIAARNHLFRVTIVGADGLREQFITGDPQGRGPGGYGFGGGNAGAGTGGALLLERLLRGGEQEAVTELHEGRRAGVARLAAGVRRSNGGAILLSVDATEVANLQRQSSLDALLSDIVHSTEDIAFIVYDDGEVTRSAGALPGESARTSILDLTDTIDIGRTRQATLRLGMRLDRLTTAERRTALRLAISLAAAAALGVLAIGLVWFRRQFGALSIEHALAQEALKRRDRLAAMGELASTVAHEIRNPLNAIAMSAQRLERECVGVTGAGDADDARELVGVIKHEAQRMNAKVQQFLEYARPPVLNPQLTPIASWLAGILAAARPLAESRHVSLVSAIGETGAARLDPEQMRQALDNLVRNAIEATPAGGEVSVGSSLRNGELLLEVRDTGPGIQPEDLPKIFDLYFTTKPTGTGVGLAVSQQIVAAHGGTIEVDGGTGHGATMRIRMPLEGAPAHA